MIPVLVSVEEVFRYAFTNGEVLPPSVITDADIAAAEQRWLVPALGEEMCTALRDPLHEEFRSQYIAPALALYTRALVQPRLDVRTDQVGTSSPDSTLTHQAGGRALVRMHRELLRQANTLMERAADHLRSHAERYPQYRPRTHASRAGGIVF